MSTYRRLALVVLPALCALSLLLPQSRAYAATLTSGSASLSSEQISATGVTYTLTFSGVTLSTTKCINIRFTDTLGSNSKPTGMTITSAALSGTSTYMPTPASWTVTNTNSTGNTALTFTSGETPASASSRTIVLSGITNGSAANTTYYAEVNTYGNTDCATTPLDYGNAAYVFTNGVVVSGTVNPSLAFSLTATTCTLGTLSISTSGTCSHTMSAATNATSGYSISYLAAPTLTSGSNTIAAIGGTAAASSQGTPQFGINLVANTVPSVGSAASGGTGAALTNYNTANSFAFNTSGAQVASAASSTATTTYTVSYLANISSLTKAGSYTTTLVYAITANY